MRDIPELKDIDDESVSMISCRWNEATMRHPPPAGNIEIEGTETLALIDTGATVSTMDMVTFVKLKTCPIISPMKTRTYPYRCMMLLTLIGVIKATVKSGAEQIKRHSR